MIVGQLKTYSYGTHRTPLLHRLLPKGIQRARHSRHAPDPRGVRVYLDRTAFYPESGGQPSDRGTLGGIPVLDVIDEGDEVAHILAGDPAERGCRGQHRLGAPLRPHAAAHRASTFFRRRLNVRAATRRFRSTWARRAPPSISIPTAWARSKSKRRRNWRTAWYLRTGPVQISFRPAAEVQQLDLRKPTFREGDIRLVEVAGFDLSACGGTHVSRTGGVGMICIRKVERAKGLTRIEFVCGGRALRRARQDFAILSEAARLFSSGLGKRSGVDRQTSPGIARRGEIRAETGGGPGGNGGRPVVAASPGESWRARRPTRV